MSERGLCVQPAGGRAVVSREDRRASLPATRASGGVARFGAPPPLGDVDQRVAPPAPSRHEMSPSRQEPKLIRWGRKAVELARRHRSSLDENTLISPEVRTIARSDREHRGRPHANSVGRPHGEGPKNLWLIQVSESSDETWAGDSPVGFRRSPSSIGPASRERNALRSRRQRLMMLG